jgi:hypothetical protein
MTLTSRATWLACSVPVLQDGGRDGGWEVAQERRRQPVGAERLVQRQCLLVCVPVDGVRLGLHERDIGAAQQLGQGVLEDGLCINEGALSLATTICCIYMDSPYKLECGRENDKRPSSKPAASGESVARNTFTFAPGHQWSCERWRLTNFLSFAATAATAG